MAAFREAAAAGADMIELDVRLTADRELVVLHDRRLHRTTSGSGRVKEHRLRDLAGLDAGSWFQRCFSGERIPTLGAVLGWLPARVGLNIEIKTDGDLRRRLTMAQRLAAELHGRTMRSRVVVSSFDHRFLRLFRQEGARVATGVLFMPVRDALTLPSVICRRTGAAMFVCGRSHLRRWMVADCRRHGILVACYGIATRSQLVKMQHLTVDAVITDYPERMLRFLQRG
jgi:glycerophosphoryl diester phosphodiesterase